jgi:hypothetical protein
MLQRKSLDVFRFFCTEKERLWFISVNRKIVCDGLDPWTSSHHTAVNIIIIDEIIKVFSIPH